MVKVDPCKESSGCGFMHRLAKVVRQGLSCDSCKTGYMVLIACLVVNCCLTCLSKTVRSSAAAFK